MNQSQLKSDHILKLDDTLNQGNDDEEIVLPQIRLLTDEIISMKKEQQVLTSIVEELQNKIKIFDDRIANLSTLLERMFKRKDAGNLDEILIKVDHNNSNQFEQQDISPTKITQFKQEEREAYEDQLAQNEISYSIDANDFLNRSSFTLENIVAESNDDEILTQFIKGNTSINSIQALLDDESQHSDQFVDSIIRAPLNAQPMNQINTRIAQANFQKVQNQQKVRQHPILFQSKSGNKIHRYSMQKDVDTFRNQEYPSRERKHTYRREC